MSFEPISINACGAGSVSPQPPRETIRTLVADILAAQGQNQPFNDDDTLAEIGIGSVDMVSLLLAVESTFDLEVPQHEITIDVFRSISTLDAMVRRLQPQLAPAQHVQAQHMQAQHGQAQHGQVHPPITRALCDNVAV
jgi:acyl carrier protein